MNYIGVCFFLFVNFFLGGRRGGVEGSIIDQHKGPNCCISESSDF